MPCKTDANMDILVDGTLTTTGEVTVRNLTITGTLNVAYNMIVEDLAINTNGTMNFSNGQP